VTDLYAVLLGLFTSLIHGLSQALLYNIQVLSNGRQGLSDLNLLQLLNIQERDPNLLHELKIVLPYKDEV